MPYTFAQLQTRVERRVIDLPAAVQAEVPDLIRAAMVELQKRHNFKVMEAESETFVTTDGTRTLGNVPTNFKEYRGKPRFVTFLGGNRELSIAEKARDVLRAISPDASGQPRVIVRGTASDESGTTVFQVYPLPDTHSDYSDGEYRIIIPYWRWLTPITSGGGSNWFTNDEHTALFIVHKAASQAFGIDWDEERMAVHNALAEQNLNIAIKADKKARLSGVETLVPHLDAMEPLFEE